MSKREASVNTPMEIQYALQIKKNGASGDEVEVESLKVTADEFTRFCWNHLDYWSHHPSSIGKTMTKLRAKMVSNPREWVDIGQRRDGAKVLARKIPQKKEGLALMRKRYQLRVWLIEKEIWTARAALDESELRSLLQDDEFVSNVTLDKRYASTKASDLPDEFMQYANNELENDPTVFVPVGRCAWRGNTKATSGEAVLYIGYNFSTPQKQFNNEEKQS